ncbi:MAG: hypothetical protein F6K61_19895 [Sphaerospermopsis sp. SIO1G1]|nr:hypothetical protein [Sphaerospermopsis sp. SIO1G1]
MIITEVEYLISFCTSSNPGYPDSDNYMEEILTLKNLLLQGDFQGALTIVEELE